MNYSYSILPEESMRAVNVLVVFQSFDGATERLALAAAVGAVQARANIRLRRLPENRPEANTSGEALLRMRREYVPPTPADGVWADAVIFGCNGRIAGGLQQSSEAAAYGKKVASETREFLSRHEG